MYIYMYQLFFADHKLWVAVVFCKGVVASPPNLFSISVIFLCTYMFCMEELNNSLHT